MVQAQALPPVRLLAPRGFTAHQLARMLHSLVRVSRRAERKPSASIASLQFPKDSNEQASLPRARGRQGQWVKHCVYPALQLDADQLPAHTAVRENGVSPGAPAASAPFPLNNFKYFLTLFSKFFSSFPHGTCSLSVSRQYLALDGIYHLLWAAFPSNPTLRKRPVKRPGSTPTGFSPSKTALSRALGHGPTQGTLL